MFEKDSLKHNLKQEREKINAIAESIGAGLALIDVNYKVLWMNPLMTSWLGIKQISDPPMCYSVFRNFSEPCGDCIMKKCTSAGEVVQRETKGEQTFQPGRHFLVTSAPIRDENEEITQVFQFIQDVTESRISIEKEQYWQEFFMKVIFNAPVGVVTADTSGVVFSWNRYMAETYGIPDSDVLGINLFERFPRMRDEGLDAKVDEVIRNKQPVMLFDWRHQAQDKALRLIDVMLYPLLDSSENVLGVASIVNDVTERSQMQQELQHTKDFLGRIFDTVTDFVFVADLDGSIIDANRAVKDTFHFDKHEIAGRPLSVVFKSQAEHAAFMEDVLKNGRIENMELDMVDRELSVHQAILSASVMTGFSDAPEVIAIIGKDVTDLKLIREKVMRVQRLNALGELASGVAHDFNNLLAVILGRSQIMMKHTEDPKMIKGLEVVERAARHGSETIKRIQSFARKRTDRDQFKRLDVNDIVNEAIEFTRIRWRNEARARGCTITLTFTPGENCSVMGNYHELLEVLTNLILNAVDAMPHGGDLTMVTETQEEAVIISVNDSGVGMPQDIKHRIFDPFFTTKGVRGTGLGLSVSYGIVERHGGTIEVFSELGGGSTFWVRLPKKDVSESSAAGEEEVFSTGPGILVVEDDSDVLDLIVEILESRGYIVLSATNGREAIDILEKNPCDILFTDLRMPGLSGWDIISAAYSANPNLTAALVTGWASQVREEELKRYRVHSLIAKPFTESEIMNVIRLAAEAEVERFSK